MDTCFSSSVLLQLGCHRVHDFAMLLDESIDCSISGSLLPRPETPSKSSDQVAPDPIKAKQNNEQEELDASVQVDEEDTLSMEDDATIDHIENMEQPLHAHLEEELTPSALDEEASEGDATIILPAGGHADADDVAGHEEADAVRGDSIQNELVESTPSSTSSRQVARHLRTPSILSSYAPSPLRFSPLPFFTATSSHSHAPSSSSLSLTPSSSTAGPFDLNQEPQHLPAVPTPDSLILLAARLRQERDDAISRLAFSSLEHDITVKTLEAELEELDSGRDALKKDLEEMVVKLIEGEKLQSALEEVTDSLSQSESSYRQAKGRLATANAELQELRQRLAEHEEKLGEVSSISVSTTHGASPLPVPSCTCRHGLEELRRENADLEEQLDRTVKEHRGATNLVLTLQETLDAKDEEVRSAREALQSERQRSTMLNKDLEKAKQREEGLKAAVTQSQAGRQQDRKDHSNESALLQDALRDVQLQLEGAANRTLSLQVRLDEENDARVACAQERDALKAQVTQLSKDIARQQSLASTMQLNTSSLLADKHEVQKSLESLVLVHLLTQQDLRKMRESRLLESKTAANSHPQSNYGDDAAFSNMVVALATTAKDLMHSQEHRRTLTSQIQAVGSKLKRLECQQANLEAELLEARAKDDSLEHLDQANASLRSQVDSLQGDLTHARAELSEAISQAEKADAASTQLAEALSEKESALALAREQVEKQQNRIASLEEELSQTRESLRIAEEEGRNLVADFNMLSEELENRQSEDETR